ncbi:MAG: hypothetical protein R3F48_04190 [Candidatus Zixiibacteriota bacterium]
MKVAVIAVCLCLALIASIYAQDPVPNVQVTAGMYFQNEEQVFICPIDTNIVVANWRDYVDPYAGLLCSIGRSTDGGATWLSSPNWLLVSSSSYQSDPTMTIDEDGTFYMAFMDFRQTMLFTDSSFILFLRSDDLGATWQGPFMMSEDHGAFFEDKQMITVDNTGSPYDGTLYMAYTRYYAYDSSMVMFTKSTDRAETFTTPKIIGPSIPLPGCANDRQAGHFVKPIVLSDGSLIVAYGLRKYDGCTSTGEFESIRMVKSTDGGETFTEPVDIVATNGYAQVDGGINVYTIPVGDADITGGPYDGSVYIAFTNGNADDVYYHTDVNFMRSTDGGESWSEPLRINDDPLGKNCDNFHPWLIVNEDGVIITLFYDQRMDPAYYSFDAFAAYSFDGGETFTTNQRISTVSSNPNDLKDASDINKGLPYEKAGKVAEYIGITAVHDKIVAMWTDTRNGNSDVYSAHYQMPFLKPRLYSVENNAGYSGLSPLIWSTCWHEGDVTYRVQIDDDSLFGSPAIDDLVSDNAYQPATNFAEDGIYYWRVKAYRTAEADSTEFSDYWSFLYDTHEPDSPILLSPGDGVTTTIHTPTFVWSYSNDATGTPESYTLELSTDNTFSTPETINTFEGLTDTTLALDTPLAVPGTYYWRVNHLDQAGNESGYTTPYSFNYITFVCGDANGDISINIGDAVYLVMYIFKGGPAPDPIESGDANCDGSTNIGDAVYIVSYIFKGGPAPCCP